MSYEIDAVSLQPIEQPWNMGVGFYVVMRGHDGRVTHLGAPVVMEPRERDDISVEGPRNTFFLDRAKVQVLMDELYRMGYRPSPEVDGRAETRGVVEAMREHIGDLRKVAFRK